MMIFNDLNIWTALNGFELFIFMFVSFLIGYFFGIKKGTKPKSKTQSSADNNKFDVNEIETIFSEIKPEIIKIIEKHKSSEQAVDKHISKSALNLESFGFKEQLDKDDLTKINGVSPFLEDKLNDLGIFSYAQISRFTENDIEKITHLIEYFPGRIERDNWVGQAKALENKKATHVE
jgi:predicted flap endonuclease-1-like 5' DNA nuclease